MRQVEREGERERERERERDGFHNSNARSSIKLMTGQIYLYRGGGGSCPADGKNRASFFVSTLPPCNLRNLYESALPLLLPPPLPSSRLEEAGPPRTFLRAWIQASVNSAYRMFQSNCRLSHQTKASLFFLYLIINCDEFLFYHFR